MRADNMEEVYDYEYYAELGDYAEKLLDETSAYTPVAFQVMIVDYVIMFIVAFIGVVFNSFELTRPLGVLIISVVFPVLFMFVIYRVYVAIIKPTGGIGVMFGSFSGISDKAAAIGGLLLIREVGPVAGLIIKCLLTVILPIYIVLYPPLYLILLSWQYSRLLKTCKKEMARMEKFNDPSVQEYWNSQAVNPISKPERNYTKPNVPTMEDAVNELTSAAKAAKDKFVSNPTVASAREKLANRTNTAATTPAAFMANRQTEAPAQKHFCGKCGTKISGGRFCPKCGASLD